MVGLLEFLSLEDIKKQYETNFYGVIRTTKAVLPSMRKNKSGRVISISSVGGLVGMPFNDVYCSSKFAVEGLFETMAPLYKSFGVYLILIGFHFNYLPPT
jgi:retinol dehydrogenase-8